MAWESFFIAELSVFVAAFFIKITLFMKFPLVRHVIVSWPERTGAAFTFCETFFAIYRPVSAGLKRDLALFIAIRADNLKKASFSLAVILSPVIATMIRRAERRHPLRLPDQTVYLPLQRKQLLLHFVNKGGYVFSRFL